jgi:membrane protein
MVHPSTRARRVLSHPLRFAWQVIQAFGENKGLLLAGAVAYNTLLSIIPILALSAIVLSQVFDLALVLEAAKDYLQLVAPLQAELILGQLEAFLRNWQVIGLLGVGMLILFSAFAFSALENALSIIFSGHFEESVRKIWVSLLLPYVFVLSVGIAILLITVLTWGLDTLAAMGATEWLPDGHALAPLLGFIGEAILFTAIYYALPHVPIRMKHALIGGIIAAIMWELMRRILVWYFSNISSVNIIYGTFATALVIVLSLEIAAIILLLGAQIIKEYSGLPQDDEPAT